MMWRSQTLQIRNHDAKKLPKFHSKKPEPYIRMPKIKSLENVLQLF